MKATLFLKKLNEKKIHCLDSFLSTYPALYLALFFLIGISLFFYFSFIYLVFIIFIWNKKSLIYALFSLVSSIIYLNTFHADIKKINETTNGKGYYKIDSIKESLYFNQKSYLYSGKFYSFSDEKNTYKNIPCTVTSKKKFSPSYIYLIEGVLTKEKYHFNLKSKNFWIKEKKILNFSNVRYEMKKKFFSILQKIIYDKNSQEFLHTLLTGDNTHKFLTYSFSKVGLQHVLAISGFHFGVLTIFFSYILRLFLPQKIVCYLLILIINFYFLFVGPLVSVERSYIMIFMALLASLLGRKYLALNALGISSIIILLLNPINISNAGFQLSFLSTFAILIGYVTFDDFINFLFKKRSSKELKDLSVISRLLEKVFNFIRGSICLSFVVNILITPVVLYNFHKFSCLGFIYNLFIPFLVGIAMMLVIFAIFFYFTIPQIGIFINYIATEFTKLILQFTSYPPAKIGFYLRCKNLPFEFVICYLATISFLFIYLRYHLEKKNNPNYFDLF